MLIRKTYASATRIARGSAAQIAVGRTDFDICADSGFAGGTMKKVVVLTGAGMSDESGIATFRDSGGLWENHRIEEVATPQGFRLNPQLVLDFYNTRRRQLLSAQPNEGHRLLAQLEEKFDVRIVTQNVDDLHERAGSTHVLHLHGELTKVRSIGPDATIYDVPPEKPDVNVGDLSPSGHQLRPHIVWFGEGVPEIENAISLVQEADALVIIGTSLKVFPAAGLLNFAASGVPIWLIDPNEIRDLPPHVRVIQKGASAGVREWIGLLEK